MELYLLRHGEAEGRSASGRDDARELTASGARGVRQVVEQAREQGFGAAWIVASPYARAQQTARIAAELLGYEEPIVPSTRLTPESSPEELWAEVRDLVPESPLLLVGHEPLLSAAASWMLGEKRVIIGFRPGTLARIDFDEVGAEPRGVLRWTLHAS